MTLSSSDREWFLIRNSTVFASASASALRSSCVDGSSRQKGKKIARFYSAQNDHINDLLKPLAAHTADAQQDATDMALKVKLAVNISFAANIVLAIVQLYAAISSLSLALFASCIDAGESRPHKYNTIGADA